MVFGREIAAWSRLGAVTGFITMVHHSAGGFGALVGGEIYDAYGSYDAAFVLLLVLSLIALGLSLALPFCGCRGSRDESRPASAPPVDSRRA